MSARILDYMRRYDYKKLVMCNDASSGLRAIIAIHSTILGPATGGLRMWPYANEEEAIFDALRLARGMTYKYAAAGVNLEAARPSSSATQSAISPRHCYEPWDGSLISWAAST
jgi:hypothetical protein